jgi:predicted GNAT family N-acyltransferase
MPELQIHTNATLPAHFAHQIRSFIRIQWFDPYALGIWDDELWSDDERPTHVVVAERQAVLSYAMILRRPLTFDGQPILVLGVSSVLTYPAFRKRGYGAQVVAEVSRRIASDPAADLGMLFTSPDLEKFYAAHGWEALRQIKVLDGPSHTPKDSGAFTMALFVSERAKAMRPAIDRAAIYGGQWLW